MVHNRCQAHRFECDKNCNAAGFFTLNFNAPSAFQNWVALCVPVMKPLPLARSLCKLSCCFILLAHLFHSVLQLVLGLICACLYNLSHVGVN